MIENDFLLHVPLFQHLNDEDRERLAGVVRHKQLKKGEVLFYKGSAGDALYIIKKGRIKISLSSGTGEEIVLAIFAEADFFGEMALLDGLPRSADAMAIEPAELLYISREDFLAFLDVCNGAVRAVLLSLSQRLRKTDDLLEDTCFLQISERFAKKLVELAVKHGRGEGGATCIDLALTQRDLASMVGATRESINKELRALREKGLVSVHENTIRIHDMERLKRRAHRFPEKHPL